MKRYITNILTLLLLSLDRARAEKLVLSLEPEVSVFHVSDEEINLVKLGSNFPTTLSQLDSIQVNMKRGESVVFESAGSSDNFFFGKANGDLGTLSLYMSNMNGVPALTGRVSAGRSGTFAVIMTNSDGTLWAEVGNTADFAHVTDSDYTWNTTPVLSTAVELQKQTKKATEKAIGKANAEKVRAEERGSEEGSVVVKPTRIKVMTPYTGEALCRVARLVYPCEYSSATEGPILSLIHFFVAEANYIFRNSDGLNVELVLVDAYLDDVRTNGIPYSTLIGNINTPDDGLFDTVFARRDAACADLIIAILDEADVVSDPPNIIVSEAAGVGPSEAYFVAVSSVTTAAIEGFDFTRALGFLLGCRPSFGNLPGQDESRPAYAHGFEGDGGDYSTIMTSRKRCDPNICTRFPVFSTPPPFKFQGVTVGNAVIANNRRRIDESKGIVKKFRRHEICAAENEAVRRLGGGMKFEKDADETNEKNEGNFRVGHLGKW